MFRLSYKLLFIFTVLAVLGGILTLIPFSSASYPNILGYRSLCTFAPAATLFCFFLAGTSCFIRSTFVKDQSGTAGERFYRHSRFLAVLLAVLLLAGASTVYFLIVKSTYTQADSETSASINYEE